MPLTSLSELLRQGPLGAGKVFDIGLQLGQYLMDDSYRQHADDYAPIHPDWIRLDDAGRPSLARLDALSGPRQEIAREVSCHSPAWILADKPAHSLEEDLFCLGMVMGCMILGRNPYETLPDGVITASGITGGPVVRLGAGPSCDPEACAAAEALLDADPARRGDGFLRMLSFAMARFPGAAKVSLVCENKTVGVLTLDFKADRPQLALQRQYTVGGVCYDAPQVSLDYWPGTHEYAIQVVRHGPAVEGVFTVWTTAPDGTPVQAFRLGEGSQLYSTPIQLSAQRFNVMLYRQVGRTRERLMNIACPVGSDSGRETEGVLELGVRSAPLAIRVSVLSADKGSRLMQDLFIPLDRYLQS